MEKSPEKFNKWKNDKLAKKKIRKAENSYLITAAESALKRFHPTPQITLFCF